MPRLSDRCTIPSLFLVRQRFPRPREGDVAGRVRTELASVLPEGSIRPGASIGVTAGSRGISRIAEITRAAVDFLKERGARPFIVPAMGSHGGATAEGQRRLIGHFGISESAMGVPIRDDMSTRSLGMTKDGVEVFLARAALESDGIILVNRVKPHTDYKGNVESGLAKICAVGLGKHEGARECHSHFFGLGLGAAIRSACEHVISTGRILGGLAILENAYHETARIAGVPLGRLFEAEARLLEESRSLLATLPLRELDVLLCDRIGKNISGTGLDTNVIGRSVHGWVEGVPWQPGLPVIYRVVVRDLTDESEGNAIGMGMADFATKRFWSKVDFEVTLINSLTASAPLNVRRPAILENDREAVCAALLTSPRRTKGKLLAHVRDTLDLEHVWLSAACLPLVKGRSEIEVLTEPAPMEFDSEGNVVSPLVGS